jgi:hypothetical protein
MNYFPEVFNSFENWASFTRSLSVEKINEFIKHGYKVEGKDEGRNSSSFINPYDDILNFLLITEKNSDGIQIEDKTTNLMIWLDYQEFFKALSRDFPLKLSFDPVYKSYLRCGFYSPNYAELYVNKNTEDFYSEEIDATKKSTNHMLEYSIDDISIYIGKSSPMWDFLIGGDEFTCTVSCLGNLPGDIEKLLSQALYYYNSNLKTNTYKLDCSSLIYPEDFANIDTYALVPNIHKKKFAFRNESIPFLLFYAANDFLGYYKVLEYFFLRARTSEIEDIRWNNKLPADKFIAEIEKIYRKTESKSLEMLIKQVVDNSMLDIAIKSKLIEENNAEALAKSIYKIRNSLVHAKETEEMEVPTVIHYPSFSDELNWTDLIRQIAINAIEKYCQ